MMICNRLNECMACEYAAQPLPACVNENRSNCIESSDNRTRIKCKENGKKYILENTQKKFVVSYKMDGGIIVEDKRVPDNTNKCDYLYIICNDETEKDAILTELKGTDISKALEHIRGTIQLFPDVFRTCTHVYGRIVVASSLPNFKARPEYVKLVKMLVHTYHGNLKIAEKIFVEKDVQLTR